MTQEGATLERILSLVQLIRKDGLLVLWGGNGFKICNLPNDDSPGKEIKLDH